MFAAIFLAGMSFRSPRANRGSVTPANGEVPVMENLAELPLSVLIPCILIVSVFAKLLGGILIQAYRQAQQSKHRRDALQRWMRGEPQSEQTR